jgi:hypothetical protein
MGDSDASVTNVLDDAYQSIRSFTRHTRGRSIAAPEAYRVLGEAAAIAAIFPQALNQVGEGLRSALREYDVYDQDRAPAESVDMAQSELAAAADAFQRAYAHLNAAQAVISLQGVNTGADGRLLRRPQLRAVDAADIDSP